MARSVLQTLWKKKKERKKEEGGCCFGRLLRVGRASTICKNRVTSVQMSTAQIDLIECKFIVRSVDDELWHHNQLQSA